MKRFDRPFALVLLLVLAGPLPAAGVSLAAFPTDDLYDPATIGRTVAGVAGGHLIERHELVRRPGREEIGHVGSRQDELDSGLDRSALIGSNVR